MSMTERYNKSHLSFLLAGLVSLRTQYEGEFVQPVEGQPYEADEWTGICGNVSRYIRSAVLPDEIVNQPPGDGGSRECIEETFKSLSIELFTSWPHYSGDKHYPVPASLTQIEAFEDTAEAAVYAFDNADLYWEGEYGDSRMILLYHMIDRLTEALLWVPGGSARKGGAIEAFVTGYGTTAAAHKPSHGGYPG